MDRMSYRNLFQRKPNTSLLMVITVCIFWSLNLLAYSPERDTDSSARFLEEDVGYSVIMHRCFGVDDEVIWLHWIETTMFNSNIEITQHVVILIDDLAWLVSLDIFPSLEEEEYHDQKQIDLDDPPSRSGEWADSEADPSGSPL